MILTRKWDRNRVIICMHVLHICHSNLKICWIVYIYIYHTTDLTLHDHVQEIIDQLGDAGLVSLCTTCVRC